MREKPLVLVAEDDDNTRELLGQMLENLGYQSHLTVDGLEACEFLEKETPDLVLSDVLMPNMDGFRLCERIKSDRNMRLIPVVLLTGLGGIDDRVKGIDAGADDFINKPFQLVELSARLKSLLRLKQFTDDLEHAEEVIISLALAVESKDPYTEGHCQRLAYYAEEVGHRMNLNDDDLLSLKRGGFLHDIGKIGMPESILMKPGPLSADEIEIMREHPASGEVICKPLRTLANTLPIIRHHHERMDGNGYPDGLKGEDIPIGARIIACVDYVDALATDRPYRKALPMEEVQALLDTAIEGGHLDPNVAKIVNAIIDEVREKWTEVKYNGHGLS